MKNLWRENDSHQSIWNEMNILDKEEHLRVRLKESAHMPGYEDLINRSSIEISIIWELLIKKE